MTAKVAEVVPLKQGLKLTGPFLKCYNVVSCRGSSIKTRIETTSSLFDYLRYTIRCRGSSIKTRIETLRSPPLLFSFLKVAEVVPLKQGLKHLLAQVVSLLDE